MKKIILFIICFLSLEISYAQEFSKDIVVGAEQPEFFMRYLKDKKVALVVNQTSMVHDQHLVDNLLYQKVNITSIFAPEHGFRGDADAGEHVANGRDKKTNLPIISLYGNNKKPTQAQLSNCDVVVYDIQDVGARFYTYISTLQYVMEACAEAKKQVIVLDRPNPNGFYVDGPVLQNKYASFVGMQSIPIVHGMTVGEYAKMLNGENMLANGVICKLIVIPCLLYTHNTLYQVPIPPSPNLRSMQAIWLYPSLCLFEGTEVSVGRGTKTPFEIWGHPDYKNNGFSFTPLPSQGAKDPLYNGKKCYGSDMRLNPSDVLKIVDNKINLSFLKNAYYLSPHKKNFFNAFFEKLVGNADLRKQIEKGMTEKEIRKTWERDLIKFKEIRKKYLIYEDFE